MNADLHIAPESLDRLPLFPLPSAVWFPSTPLALHVFEPRYRALVIDCLAGDRALAVPLLRPGYEEQYDGAPDFFPVAGVGKILKEQALPGGRWNVLLAGVLRVRLHEVPSGSSYRTARAEPLDDVYPARGPEALRGEVATLLSAVSPIVAFARRTDERFSLGIDAGMSPGRIADLCAHRLLTETNVRQEILETLDVRVRIARVTTEISARLATMPGTGTLQ